MNTPVKPLLLVFSVLFSISAYSLAQAATYYVAPTGNNTNPGTISQPFGTLQKAHDIANPGDTIYMRGGTYQFSVAQTLTKGGSSGSPFNLFNYPGETPILDGINMTLQAGMQNDYSLVLNGANWWHVKGIEVERSPSGGILLYGNSNNNTIEMCVSHNNGRLDTGDGTGIRILGSGSNNLLLNNDSHHNRDQSADGGNADGFSVVSTGSGNVMRGNRAWFNSDDGYDFFNVQDGTTAPPVLIENNWSWRNGYDDALNPLGNGQGFKLGGIRTSTGGFSGAHIVRNNISFLNKGNGFDQNAGQGGAAALTVYNNASYNNAGNSFIVNAAVASIVRNNWYYLGGSQAIYAGATNDHNSWNGGVIVNTSDFVTMDYTANTGPRKADGSLPDSDFLHLALGSDLIDKGINVGIAYTGSAPDLGAYEYTNSVVSLQAPSSLVVKP
jgi:hypothetical protein